MNDLKTGRAAAEIAFFDISILHGAIPVMPVVG
jgi:hypothetical protein